MLDFKSTLKMAINSLRVNMLRSALTSLGVIIGVSAVIIMLAVGSGASKKVTQNMESMGTNLLTVRSASAKSGGVHMGMGTKPTLTSKDAIAIEKNARGILAISTMSSESKQLTYGNQNWSTSVYGIQPAYLYIKNYELNSGRSFVPEDLQNSAKVALLGSTVATELFGDVDPVGKVIRVGNIPFKVIGLLNTKGQTGPFDQDDLIFIPITTAQKKVFGTDFPGTVSQIVIKGQDADTLDETIDDIDEILTARHNLGKNQDKDFEIRNSAEFQEKMKSTVQTFAILLASIASVSLLVGGIGIMNIMLVSVTERTKEIGIRMAVGARKSDILQQFLIEAILVCLFGGILGIILSFGIGVVFSMLSASMRMIFSVVSIVLAVTCSTLIGVIFGYLPAKNAAKLDPIVALARE